MKKNNLIGKGLVIGIILLFVGAGCITSIGIVDGSNDELDHKLAIENMNMVINREYKTVSYNSLNDGWYWLPSYPNYVPSGMPDFDMNQNQWQSIFDGGNGVVESTAVGDDIQIHPFGASIESYSRVVAPGPDCHLASTPGGDDEASYMFCGAIGVANCFWWYDSKFGDSDGSPGDGEDVFPLVEDYGSGDDHAIGNEILFIERIANAVDTTGNFSGEIEDVIDGIENWFVTAGLDDFFKVDSYENPTFEFIQSEIERNHAIILELGIYFDIGGYIWHLGWHLVTCAGVNSDEFMIAICDARVDVQNPASDPTEHNDPQYVSHDIYRATIGSPDPGIDCEWWLRDYHHVHDNDYTTALGAIIISPVNEPNTPHIDGPTSGEAGTEYEYIFSTTHPSGVDVYYSIDWGDGSEVTIGPYASGEEATAKHTWDKRGKFTIKARAKDIDDLVSDWATLIVSMPKNKAYINTPFFNFLQNNLHLFPILQQLLKL